MEPEKDPKSAEAPKPAPEQQTHTLLLCTHPSYQELRDTLIAIDKAVANKELRSAIKLSRQARKYKNVAQGHHLLQVANHLNLGANESLFKNSANFNAEFSEPFDLGKSLQGKFSKVIELEAFVKVLLIQYFWREKHFAACKIVVKELL